MDLRLLRGCLAWGMIRDDVMGEVVQGVAAGTANRQKCQVRCRRSALTNPRHSPLILFNIKNIMHHRWIFAVTKTEEQLKKNL